MPKISKKDREEFLADCFQDGLDLADPLAEVFRLAAIRAHQLLGDAESLSAFGQPLGWNVKYFGKAVERFPEWFQPDSPKSPTSQQLQTLFKLAQLSLPKSIKMYAEWEKHGYAWDLREVGDRVNEEKGRVRLDESNSFKVEGEVKFLRSKNIIQMLPAEKFAWDRSSGPYVIRMKSKTGRGQKRG